MAHQSDMTLTRARTLRKGDTEAERRLWEDLHARRLGGFKFVRQLPVEDYFADFACRERKLIVEVDGASRGNPDEFAHDERRTQFPEKRGWKVLRFWNHDAFTARNLVCDAILVALEVYPFLISTQTVQSRGPLRTANYQA
jgi:very-short-patch-repair endonuclease